MRGGFLGPESIRLRRDWKTKRRGQNDSHQLTSNGTRRRETFSGRPDQTKGIYVGKSVALLPSAPSEVRFFPLPPRFVGQNFDRYRFANGKITKRNSQALNCCARAKYEVRFKEKKNVIRVQTTVLLKISHSETFFFAKRKFF